MKTTIYLLAVATLAGGIILSGCKPAVKDKEIEKAEKNVTEAKQDLTQAQQEYEAVVGKFKQETADKISDNNKSIAEIKTRIATKKKEIRERYNNKIDALEQKNRELQKRIDDYSLDRKDQWESFKREFDHDMDELGKSLKDFTVDNAK